MKISYHRSTIKGFTLVELLIVVTILALLAALAYPLYHKNVVDARIENVRADLLKNAAQLERVYIQNRSFSNIQNTDIKEKNQYFDITVTSKTDDAYTLEAKPNTQNADFFKGYVDKVIYDSRNGQIKICETATSCKDTSSSSSSSSTTNN